jgi:hypothetical protein
VYVAEFDSATYTLVVDVYHIVSFVGRFNRRRGDEDTDAAIRVMRAK